MYATEGAVRTSLRERADFGGGASAGGGEEATAEAVVAGPSGLAVAVALTAGAAVGC